MTDERMRRKCKLCFLVASLTIMIFMMAPKQQTTFLETDDDTDNEVIPTEECWLPIENDSGRKVDQIKSEFKRRRGLSNSTKVVLLYTGLFFSPYWWGKNEKQIQKYTHDKKCEIRDCYFTYRKNTLQVADLVIFHIVDLNKPYCIRKMSERRPDNQKWLLFMHESPIYTKNLKKYNQIFNWTMTYMQKSDIYVPYFSYQTLAKHSEVQGFGKNFAEGKVGKVVWVVSHCGLLRDDYVLELQRYIDVTVFGDCSSKFKKSMGRCNDWGTFCEEEIKKYKFYLAFENCFCEDYITEKYWEKGLKYGLIPIVMGAISGKSKVIPNSYIDVNNFQSIQELAAYLSYLDKNDTAYNEYFKWRYHYEVNNNIDALCEVCKAVHDRSRQSFVYRNIGKFWSKKINCDPYQWKVDHIKMQISKSKFRFNT